MDSQVIETLASDMRPTETGVAGYRRRVSITKRANILEAARHEFAERGFSDCKMSCIADRADVSTATLYKHFASKELLWGVTVQAMTPEQLRTYMVAQLVPKGVEIPAAMQPLLDGLSGSLDG